VTSGPLRDSYCREFLITNQNSDGGWGFHPISPSAVEATAWALTALISSRPGAATAEVCARARDWLLQAQQPDGSRPPFPGQPQGCWATSVASHALRLQGGAENAVKRGRDWVLNAWPAEGTVWWRLRQTLFPSRLARQNSSLRGWNWTPGTASWVEPTAHALLFLRSLPEEMHSSQGKKRRQLAERMLYDRMCPRGGWNSGNPLVYGVAGVPTDEKGARKTFEWAKKMGIQVLVTETTPSEMLDKLCNEYHIKMALHNHPQSWPPEKVPPLGSEPFQAGPPIESTTVVPPVSLKL